MREQDITMEVGSQWYNRVAAEIDQYRITLGKKDAGKYKLDLLMRVAKRIDDFSQTCGECESYKSDVTNLVHELGLLVQMPNREGQRKHTRTINTLVEHMKKVHKLVDKGYYVGMGIGIGMALGAGIGAALGAIVDSPGVGTGIGIAVGVAVGTYLDRKAKSEGKVI
jgi:hypothetical protein